MTLSPISEQMRLLLPTLEDPDSSYPPAFNKMADLLLNRANLLIQGHAHRLTEIEFYFNGGNHADKFTHGDKMQKTFGFWYFHRFGSEYRSGTYKGIDIAFGSQQSPAGILIRGMERLSDNYLLDGPSVSVDHILKLTASPTIVDLVAKFDLSIDPKADSESPLYLVEADDRKKAVLPTPRVGLSLKRENTQVRWSYIARNYRFVTEPLRIKKGKIQMVIGLHHQGKTFAEISKLIGSKEATVKSYIDWYEVGKDKLPSQFKVELPTEDLCGLFGACQKYI